MSETQRNDPCPCGSGKKYKKCCMNKKQTGLSMKGLSGGLGWVCMTLIVIIVLSVALRYYGFHQPHGLTFDEGLYADLLAPQLKEDPTHYSTQEAYRIHTAAGQRLPAYLDRPLFKHPPLYCYFIALNYTIFGASNLAAVSVSILFGGLMVLIVFLLGKELYDHRVGLLAAGFLCIDPVHWVCSERIWMETTMSFFILLAVYLFALGQKKSIYLPLSGLSIGLAMLTKYPGVLPLFVIFVYVLFTGRSMMKQKGFWLLCLVSALVFLPWALWNWNVYGNLDDILVLAHALKYHWGSTTGILKEHTVFLFVFFALMGGLYIFRNKIRSLFEKASPTSKSHYVFPVIGVVLVLPLFWGMAQEAFVWKNTIKTGWSNPFVSESWQFYLIRLNELSPLYLFSFLSVFLAFGKNKGDHLLWLTSFLILGAFILLGNYQSRYILPAVPFLLILSARLQVWLFDRFSSKMFPKILLMGIVFYFILQTLRVDSLIAIGPDFGYF